MLGLGKVAANDVPILGNAQPGVSFICFGVSRKVSYLGEPNTEVSELHPKKQEPFFVAISSSNCVAKKQHHGRCV